MVIIFLGMVVLVFMLFLFFSLDVLSSSIDKPINKKAEKKKEQTTQAMKEFFTDCTKDNVRRINNYGKFYRIYTERANSHVSLYLQKTKADTDFFLYVKGDRVLNATYRMEGNRKFLEIDDFERLLDKESRAYVHAALLSLVEPVEASPNLAKEANTEAPKAETLPVHWTYFASEIKDTDILAYLYVLSDLSDQINRHIKGLDTEELHRLERLEETVLPNVLASFSALSAKEQTFHKQTLLQSLANAQQIFLELQQKEGRNKEHAFQKNATLLKNM